MTVSARRDKKFVVIILGIRMRTALHEFFRPTKEEFEKFWADALITFDASSLLNLYGYSSGTKRELIEAYETFEERIILPYQFALEYSRNRSKVISNQISNFQKAEGDLESLVKKHQNKQEQPYLSEKSLKSLEAIKRELAKGKSKMEKSMASDEESDFLSKLFRGKIGAEPDAEDTKTLLAEGKTRYSVEIPPGYKDFKEKGEPDCYGDFIAWKQIMTIALQKKSDFIIVTDDVKEDWWHYQSSRLVGPLPALRKEFRNVTGQSVWLYTTEGFLRAAKEFSSVNVGESALREVSAALDTKQKVHDRRFLKLKNLGEWATANSELIKSSQSLEAGKKKAVVTDSDEAEDDES